MDTLAIQVGAALKSHGLRLVTAESCTGGGVAQLVTDVAGSSAWFDRGFITYSNLSKQQMLDVKSETLNAFGAVSELTVREMVAGALQNSSAQVAVAISGIAGPGGGSEEKPVGTVWFAWGIKHGTTLSSRQLLEGNRAAVRVQAGHIALQGILDLLKQHTVLA